MLSSLSPGVIKRNTEQTRSRGGRYKYGEDQRLHVIAICYARLPMTSLLGLSYLTRAETETGAAGGCSRVEGPANTRPLRDASGLSSIEVREIWLRSMKSSQAQSKRLTLRPEWRDNRLSFVASIKPSPSAGPLSPPTMEQSPLTLQARPEVFEPKVVQLYKRLFKVSVDLYNTPVEPVTLTRYCRRSKRMTSPRVSGKNSFS